MMARVEEFASKLGNWQDAIDYICRQASKEDEFTSFTQNTDDLQRVKFVYNRNYLGSVPWLQAHLEGCKTIERKSSEKAKHFRNQGNKEFQKKKFDAAFELYTQSVLFSPHHGGDINLALALGNRSAVLYHLGKFEACIVDIDLSLKAGFPDENLYKLLQRKGQCLFKLGQNQESKIEFQKALDNLHKKEIVDKSKQDETTAWLNKSEISESVPMVFEGRSEFSIPELSYGRNSVVLQASSAVSLQYNTTQGRHLVATRAINEGDTLIVERPFAAVLLPDHYTTHCHHCFDIIKIAYPCHQCSSVRFCSILCQETSWEVYHQYECQYLELLHSVGIAHLSLRVILTAGLDHLKDFRQRLTDYDSHAEVTDIPGVNKGGKYERDYWSVYHLMPHTEDIVVEDLFQYTLTAALLGRILQDSKFFSPGDKPSHSEGTEENLLKNTTDCPKKNEYSDQMTEGENLANKMAAVCVDNDHMTPDAEDVSFIQGLVLRHIQQLICNAHAITELQVSQLNDNDIVDAKSQVRVATAIYPTASLLNHSCDPTIISSFHKDTLVVRSVKDVCEGGEIFTCYGPHCKRMCRSERQEALTGQYFFTCTCEACMGKEESDQVFQALRCSSCEGPVYKIRTVLTCKMCGQTTAGVQENDDILQAQTLFIEGLESMNQGNSKGGLCAIEKCYDIQTRVLYKYNRDLAQTNDCLARYWAMLGDFDKAATYLENSVETNKLIYGADSVETGHELQKLAEILFNGRQVEKALSVIEQAMTILTMHYGENSSVSEPLERMKLCLLKYRTDMNINV